MPLLTMLPSSISLPPAMKFRSMKMRVKALSLVFVLSLSGAAIAQQGGALVSVDEVVSQPLVQTSPVIGRLVATQFGVVAAQTSGAVSEMLVQIGDQVKQGQVLATLDASTLLLQKQLADSRVNEAESRLKTARAQFSLASQELKRLEGLKSAAAVSRATYDDAKQQQTIASARVREAQAAIQSSSASSKLSELELTYTSIVAPFNGTVVEKMTETGSYVQRGQAVVRLISGNSLEVEADVPVGNLTGLTVGTKVGFELDNGSQHQATVRAVIPRENPRTRTRRVRFTASFGDDAGLLASDQNTTVLVPVSEQRDALTVHKDAIVRKGPNEMVYVVIDGKAKVRPVKTALAVGNRLEIIEGLAPGDQVVVRGNERLRPDQDVQVAP